ncbi:MAG TPA: hypothetical protein VK586_26380 [Streptosporangiaceae bacterium]|nr:hypothetical protein [Streptosporangiaceae bacterium]
MRLRTGRWLVICCCAGLTACTAGPPAGPDAAVTAPAVGRPPPPSSVQAALSRDAFTPYAAVGQSNNDGLAPNESNFALAGACMTAAGYPGGRGAVPLAINMGEVSLVFSQPWGGWGYLGAAEARQYGFLVPPGSALTALTALGVSPQPADPAGLPLAERAAAAKCGVIVQDFTDATRAGALAGIAALSTDIGNDVTQDAAVKNAVHSWSACMTRNGYRYPQPQRVFYQELGTIFGRNGPVNTADPVSTAARQAQLAVAVTDAACTQSADLAGIYFAVQASYEQQLVNANQQALTAAVRRYRTAYQKELSKLPALLRTTRALPVPAG